MSSLTTGTSTFLIAYAAHKVGISILLVNDLTDGFLTSNRKTLLYTFGLTNV